MGVPEDVQEQLRGPALGGWPQLGDQTVVDALADVRDTLVQPIESLVTDNGVVAFTLPDYIRFIDAAVYRMAKVIEGIAESNARIEKKLEGK